MYNTSLYFLIKYIIIIMEISNIFIFNHDIGITKLSVFYIYENLPHYIDNI